MRRIKKNNKHQGTPKMNRIKTLPLTAFMAVFVSLLASPVFAAQVYQSKAVNLYIDGDITGAVFITEQDDNTIPGPDDADGNPTIDSVEEFSTGQIRGDGRIGIQADTVLDNGYKVGTRFEFELTSDLEMAYIFISGPFGELQVGQIDNVSTGLQFYVPEFLAPAIDTVDYPDFQAYGRSSVADGPQYGDSTFIVYDEVAHKINYISPRIQGVQFGIGWTPDPTASFDNSSGSGIQGRADQDHDRFPDNVGVAEDLVTFTANYSREEIFDITWGISGAYMIAGGHSVPNTTPTAYNVGFNIGWKGWELGGSWQESRDLMVDGELLANDNPMDDFRVKDRVWAIGFAYGQDQWKVGAAYRTSRRDENSSRGDKTNKEVEIGATYNLGKGLWISGMFEYVNDLNPYNEQTLSSRLESYNGGLLFTFQF